MKNKSLLGREVKIFGLDEKPKTAYIWKETKSYVEIRTEKEFLKHGNRTKQFEFKFSKITKQPCPKSMHKNFLVEFGTIPYFELIEDEKQP